MQNVKFANIPDELKQRKSWVLWKYLIRNGNKTKVLFQTNGQTASSTDPSTWDTLDAVRERMQMGAWEGVGYVFSPDDPYTGIDLDGCRNPETGKTEDWAREIVLQLASYAELSPSMSGIKIWVRAEWPQGAGHNAKLPEMAKVSDKTPGIEVYSWGRFFTVTGCRVTGPREITENQVAVTAIRERFFKPATPAYAPSDFKSEVSVIDRARKYIAKIERAVSGQNGSAPTFKAACTLVKGFGLTEEDALSLMREWNTTHCDPPWSERELMHKVTSAGQQPGECGYLRNVAPDNYRHVPTPEYQEPQREPGDEDHIPTPPDDIEPRDTKPTIRVTLMEDAARATLRDYVEGRGKLLDLGLPDLDYAIGGGVEPGEMIIFAGRPNHGKTMAVQQASYTFTGAGIPVMFVSEEMPARLIGKRAIHYSSAIPSESWDVRSAAVEAELDSHFKNRAPCYILEGCRTAETVADQIRFYVKEHGVGLAIIDYAQKLTAGNGGRGRYEEITKVSIAIKNVLAECNVPGLILCQMSRAVENRPEFVPVMSDLKESGQFEQDADVIVFQVWPHKINSQCDPNEYLFYIAKNRNRETNQAIVKCKFEPKRQRLINLKSPMDEIPSFDHGAFEGVDGNFGP